MLDFTEKIEQHQVNWDRGASEAISYRHRDGTVVETRAFIDYADIRKEDSDERKDNVYFYLIKLEKEPKFHDSIKYNDKVYVIESWKKHNAYSTLYDVVTISERALKHRRH
jgi:hypothetical protein